MLLCLKNFEKLPAKSNHFSAPRNNVSHSYSQPFYLPSTQINFIIFYLILRSKKTEAELLSTGSFSQNSWNVGNWSKPKPIMRNSTWAFHESNQSNRLMCHLLMECGAATWPRRLIWNSSFLADILTTRPNVVPHIPPNKILLKFNQLIRRKSSSCVSCATVVRENTSLERSLAFLFLTSTSCWNQMLRTFRRSCWVSVVPCLDKSEFNISILILMA